MEPNPNKPSKAEAIMHEAQMAKAHRFKTGARMAAIAVALPFIAWLLANGLVAFAASLDPVPDQGLMVFAFLAFAASVVVALVLFSFGITLALTNWTR
jgi:hypothetical protein